MDYHAKEIQSLAHCKYNVAEGCRRGREWAEKMYVSSYHGDRVALILTWQSVIKCDFRANEDENCNSYYINEDQSKIFLTKGPQAGGRIVYEEGAVAELGIPFRRGIFSQQMKKIHSNI